MESFGFYWNHFLGIEVQNLQGLLELVGFPGSGGVRPARVWLVSQAPIGLTLLSLCGGGLIAVVMWRERRRAKWRDTVT